MSDCKRLDWCIGRAMEYAQKNDFKQARKSFCSDIMKSPCTKVISEQPLFSILILFTNVTNVAEFETLVKGFSHSCICNK